jgi:UrcA family protein
MTRLIIPLGVIAALATASAQAGEWRPLTEKVSYSDLDLTRDTDVAMFDSRLGAAVVKVCRPTYQGGRVAFEHVRRCTLVSRADYAKPRALALAAAKTRMAVAKPIVVATAR